MNQMKVKLTGIAPLLCHNNQTADPLNFFAKELKKISSKRNKTESDLEQISKLEFLSGLYLYEDIPVLPAKMFSACFIKGAKKGKNGPIASAGTCFYEHSSIEYPGSKEPEKMYESNEFVFRCPVKIGKATIIRTRPIFKEWSTIVVFDYEKSIIDKNIIMLAWEKAGQVVGMGDWRPQYGRFRVEEINGRRRKE